MIRVVLPPHLRTLAHVGMEVNIDVQGAITQRSILDALEASYPMLRGTIRDHDTKERRPFLRSGVAFSGCMPSPASGQAEALEYAFCFCHPEVRRPRDLLLLLRMPHPS